MIYLPLRIPSTTSRTASLPRCVCFLSCFLFTEILLFWLFRMRSIFSVINLLSVLQDQHGTHCEEHHELRSQLFSLIHASFLLPFS